MNCREILRFKRSGIGMVVLVLWLWLGFAGIPLVMGNSLDDYVSAPDANYNCIQQGAAIDGNGYTAYVLNMTSQAWRSSTEVNRTLWKHWVIVVVPDNLQTNTALLHINGGNNDETVPGANDYFIQNALSVVAKMSHSIVVDVRMVPNQPLCFTDESWDAKTEDEIIAYSFDKQMVTGDDTWAVLLPMVKSVVRAMDAAQSFVSTLSGVLPINDFVVAGASKRGWTTWLTAVYDRGLPVGQQRVRAIIPLVIDVLNMDEQMRHHFSAYGFYAPAIQDYVNKNVFDRLDTPEGQQLLHLVDPFEYCDRLTMPKYIVNSSGDQFFLPDSSQFYYHDIPGENYLCYVPNTDHSLGILGGDTRAIVPLVAFYTSIWLDLTLPEYSWEYQADGTVVVQTNVTPKNVFLYQAHVSKANGRDFRLEKIGGAWNQSTLTDQGGNIYIGQVSYPTEGWTGYFVKLVIDSGLGIDYEFTTEIKVVPDYLPFICDFDRDGDVDIEDLGVMAGEWLAEDGYPADVYPRRGDGAVNLQDFSVFMRNWTTGG